MLQSSTEEGSQNMSSRGDPLASNSMPDPNPFKDFSVSLQLVLLENW